MATAITVEVFSAESAAVLSHLESLGRRYLESTKQAVGTFVKWHLSPSVSPFVIEETETPSLLLLTNWTLFICYFF